MSGKTIRIFLADGSPTGILAAEVMNWTGIILVSPRSLLSELAKRGELSRTGVYCLIGQDPENLSRDSVYIGEADKVLTRLKKHDKDESMDFWIRCAVIVSKDENLTKAHGRYLESRLIGIAHLAGRALVKNETAPPLPKLPEPDVADMESFLSQLQVVFPILGFNFLQPKLSVSTGTGNADDRISPTFALTVPGAQAKAKEVGGVFVVLKGSTARREGLKNWITYRALRDKLVGEGKLAPAADSSSYVFTEDVEFNSPSAGAAVVNAGNISGRKKWKVVDTGETYQEWHDKRLAAAVDQEPLDE